MKYLIKTTLLLGFFVTILLSCSPIEVKTVSSDQLIERDEITYEKFSDTPFTGNLLDFYKNGQLKEKRSYKNGKEDGAYERYFEDGQLRERGSYKKGKENGSYEIYFENGQLKEKRSYKNGKEDGAYERYFEDGQLWDKGSYREGKLYD